MEEALPSAGTSIEHGARKECKQISEKTARAITQTRARNRRDSSLDSGIHQALSDSDLDDFSEAVNSRLCYADSVRLSPVGCNETDNLVEEVYVVGHNRTAVAEDGTSSMRSFSDDSLVESTVKKKQSQIYASQQKPNDDNNNNDTNDGNIEVLSDDEKSVSTSFSSSSSPSCSSSGEQVIKTPADQVIYKTNDHPLPKSLPVSVVVAIDLGTTYSGYAFKYVDHPTDIDIHMMRNCEGEPGLNNQKSPTILLLDPQQNFHSFGCTARDYYHDLEPSESHSWYYFDKFKMTLHNNTDINRNSILHASNGSEVNALMIFSYALQYFKSQAMNELHSHSGKSTLTSDEVQWVITVPAIWSHTAKQFIREAAFKAGLFSPNQPERLLIALEPEVAAIWCRSLRTSQMEESTSDCDKQSEEQNGHCYMVVDCGGGTVDITVHRLQRPDGSLQELHKATGGSCGSLGVDEEFDRLLGGIFGFGFMSRLKIERPAAYTELMLSFESRKRTASPQRHSSLNISPPFAFIDHFRKVTGKEVESVIEAYGRPEIKWSSQGCIRLHPSLMAELFRPTVERIIQHIETVLSNPRVSGIITHLYLVGGFAESQILQQAIRQNFTKRLKVIIPQGVALSVLRGAVLFGVNPKVVSVRQARHTYGIGVLRKFQDGVHPVQKLVVKDGQEWCADVLDPLVEMNQTLRVGEMVIRRYTPATNHQSLIVLHIYCAQSPKAKFVTDHGVRRIGTLKLDLSPTTNSKEPREIIARLTFGGTEVTASAFDTSSQQYVDTDLSFLT